MRSPNNTPPTLQAGHSHGLELFGGALASLTHPRAAADAAAASGPNVEPLVGALKCAAPPRARRAVRARPFVDPSPLTRNTTTATIRRRRRMVVRWFLLQMDEREVDTFHRS